MALYCNTIHWLSLLCGRWSSLLLGDKVTPESCFGSTFCKHFSCFFILSLNYWNPCVLFTQPPIDSITIFFQAVKVSEITLGVFFFLTRLICTDHVYLRLPLDWNHSEHDLGKTLTQDDCMMVLQTPHFAFSGQEMTHLRWQVNFRGFTAEVFCCAEFCLLTQM